MSKKYGGKQSILRASLIKQERGYLGRFPRTFNPGDMQQMVFLQDGEGPFWMTSEQRQSTRLDIEIQGKVIKRNFTKEELMKKLAEQGVVAQGNITNIKWMCTLKGIPLDEQIKKTSLVGKGKQS